MYGLGKVCETHVLPAEFYYLILCPGPLPEEEGFNGV
jgi:hypothetical protein